jgi:uncharacterized protein (DUF1499 family)
MSLIRWFTKNSANTADPTHTDLVPLRLPGTGAEAVKRLTSVTSKLPGWEVVVADPDAGTMHLVRTSGWRKRVDDIHLICSEEGAGTRVDAESKGRDGGGDYGRNRRNILELWRAAR